MPITTIYIIKIIIILSIIYSIIYLIQYKIKNVNKKQNLFKIFYNNNKTYLFNKIKPKYINKNNDIIKTLKETLLSTDISIKTINKIIKNIQCNITDNIITNDTTIKTLLKSEFQRIFNNITTSKNINIIDNPSIIMFIGVNGSGKTSAIGKLANILKINGKSILLAAGDTFRAAALQQLNFWALKTNVNIIYDKQKSDPSSILFKAVKKAQKNNINIVLCDTAGRLHTKNNLMHQLKKMYKALNKAYTKAPHEILLVIDANNGKNSIIQAKEFMKHIPITGIILTKLDGSAQGGNIISIVDELKIPIKYISIGETINDLYKFNDIKFISSILD